MPPLRKRASGSLPSSALSTALAIYNEATGKPPVMDVPCSCPWRVPPGRSLPFSPRSGRAMRAQPMPIGSMSLCAAPRPEWPGRSILQDYGPMMGDTLIGYRLEQVPSVQGAGEPEETRGTTTAAVGHSLGGYLAAAFLTMANPSACLANWRLRRAFSSRSRSSTALLSCERRACSSSSTMRLA